RGVRENRRPFPHHRLLPGCRSVARRAPEMKRPVLRPGASELKLLSPCSFDTERVKSSTHRNLVKVCRLRHGGCTDGTELVAEVEAGRDRQSDPAADAAPHRHVLLAGHLVGDRVTDDAGAQTTLPRNLSVGAVDGAEVAVQAAVESEATV